MLVPGTRVGPYQVVAPLGAGGMGEVYRARDTKLDRDVAIKVLPSHLAEDGDALARFEREAKAVAALSHPNILAIHDFGTHDRTAFAVMELLDGETLRQRLTGGSLPSRKAVEFALQVASGLAAAHEKGIVHRDLKPENLFVTRDGRVKILDFGLAKLQPTAGAGGSLAATVAAGTAPGVVLGTVGYMAPEQVRGQAADHRADIFAFGAILYEMLGGARAFTGDSAVETMNAILKEEPPDLPAAGVAVPPVLDRVVRRCLEKNPDERFQSARDLGFALQAISGATGPSSTTAVATVAGRSAGRWRAYALGGGAGALLAVVGAAVLWVARPSAPSEPRRVVRFSIDIPSSRALGSFAFAPDGSRLAYVATEDGTSRIYVRSLDQSTDAALAGTEGALSLFFSPDSQWVAFFAAGRLRKVLTRGGEVVSIADAAYSGMDLATIPSGAWSDDGTIVLSVAGRGLLRVPASGGAPASITEPAVNDGDQLHLWPHIEGGRRSVLFTVSTAGDFDAARIEEVAFEGGTRTRVLPSGAHPIPLPTGHLLYADGGRLVAAPFDPTKSPAAGAPVPVAEHLAHNNKEPLFDVSAAGDLAFAVQTEPPTPEVLRVDRRGRAERLTAAIPGMSGAFSLSPDGLRLVGWRTTRDRSMSLWVLDLARGAVMQLPGPGRNHLAIWSPDGRALVSSSDREGAFNLFAQSADGTGVAERLTTSAFHEDPGSWSPDGRLLAYAVAHPETKADIRVLDRTTGNTVAFKQTPADERCPAISPDGGWMAYASDESGRPEIYAEAFPGGGGRVQLSTEGGTEPAWSPAGGELFYRDGRRLMSVRVKGGLVLAAERPLLVFEGEFDEGATYGLPGYVPGRDGQHFYFVRGSFLSQRPSRIEIVLNWLEEFKARIGK